MSTGEVPGGRAWRSKQFRISELRYLAEVFCHGRTFTVRGEINKHSEEDRCQLDLIHRSGFLELGEEGVVDEFRTLVKVWTVSSKRDGYDERKYSP